MKKNLKMKRMNPPGRSQKKKITLRGVGKPKREWQPGPAINKKHPQKL